MSKALIEDIFNDSEEAQEITFPATDRDLLILTEKFLGFEIPSKVFLQAIAIAAYDCASAFRYVDNYLAMLKNKNKRKHKKLLVFKAATNFENN
ncbi:MULTISPECIES: hypothetical protein [Nostoc]|uniref:Uncharacterized protein n=1 Tax=Nostoc paludosum FACHB-159 TaxID=2692908 RepID=A0ABR8JZV0_9NOSO|nr:MULTISPECIES: hypothetical protein [Nostoc]MBD2676518.1 hypothetical protein [Nostoc sp. FACHB-857]MBD2732348.1 hypothetical protein [Nostoc paludosum FACHB-159]